MDNRQAEINRNLAAEKEKAIIESKMNLEAAKQRMQQNDLDGAIQDLIYAVNVDTGNEEAKQMLFDAKNKQASSKKAESDSSVNKDKEVTSKVVTVKSNESIQNQKPAEVKINGLANSSLTFSSFNFYRDGKRLIVTTNVKNSGKLEDMIDSAKLVIKPGTGNSVRPVVGIVGDPYKADAKDWKKLLSDDSTTIVAQYNIEKNDTTQYNLIYVYDGENKPLLSFSENEVKQNQNPLTRTDGNAQKDNSTSSSNYSDVAMWF